MKKYTINDQYKIIQRKDGKFSLLENGIETFVSSKAKIKEFLLKEKNLKCKKALLPDWLIKVKKQEKKRKIKMLRNNILNIVFFYIIGFISFLIGLLTVISYIKIIKLFF